MNMEQALPSDSEAGPTSAHTDLRAVLESEMKSTFRELLVAQKILAAPTVDSLVSLLNSSGPTSAEILVVLTANSSAEGEATHG